MFECLAFGDIKYDSASFIWRTCIAFVLREFVRWAVGDAR